MHLHILLFENADTASNRLIRATVKNKLLNFLFFSIFKKEKNACPPPTPCAAPRPDDCVTPRYIFVDGVRCASGCLYPPCKSVGIIFFTLHFENISCRFQSINQG